MGSVGVRRPLLMVVAAVMLVVSAVVCNSLAYTAGEEAGGHQHAELTEEGPKQKEADVGEEAKETSESWAGWAKDKIQEGLGLKHDAAAAAAGEAEGKLEQVISESGEQMTGKTGEMMDKGSEKAKEAGEKASETTERATEKAVGAKDAAWEKAKDAKEKVGQTASEAAKKASDAKEAAYMTAEAAKEMACQHAEQVKEKMANKAGEAKDKVDEKFEQVKEAAKVKAMGRSTGDEGNEHASDLEDYLSSAAAAAKGGYDTAKRKAAETLETAKDTISSNHDAAKRKSQETAGRGHDDEL